MSDLEMEESTVNSYVNRISKSFALAKEREPDLTKGKFYCRVLEISGTHPETEHSMVPDLLAVMMAINENNVLKLIKDEKSFIKTNMILQYGFIQKRVDVVREKAGEFQWSKFQERYLEGVEVKIRTDVNMRLMVNALNMYWSVH